MTKQDILNYIMRTPSNTNPAVLGNMLDESFKEVTPDCFTFTYGKNVNEISVDFYENKNSYAGKCHITVGQNEVICTDWATPKGQELSQDVVDFVEPILTSMFEVDVYDEFLTMIYTNEFEGVTLQMLLEEDEEDEENEESNAGDENSGNETDPSQQK